MGHPHTSVPFFKGDLAQGAVSLASHLGLSPEKTVFANSLVVDPKGSSARLAASDDLEGVSHQYVLGLSAPGSTVLHLPLTPAQKHYVESYIVQGTLHEVRPPVEGRIYPSASIIATLNDRAEQCHILGHIQGKTLVNSYVTADLEALAGKVGGQTLMAEQHFLRFVGKEYVHEQAEKAGLSVPPGVVIYQPQDTARKVAEFRKLVKAQGLDPENTKVWVKPTSLSGGQGVKSCPAASHSHLLGALEQVDKAYRNCGFENPSTKAKELFGGLDYFMPVVMEIDVGVLPGVKKIAMETGVQAVLGARGITHIETVVNRTKNGEYIGGSLPTEADKPYTEAAESAAKKLLSQMWQDGYRGYVGVDAIVAEKTDGSLQAYLNEANTRLTGNTPLVSLAHRFSALSGSPKLGMSASFRMPLPANCPDAFAAIADQLEGQLFRGVKSGYTGIIPAVVDVPPGRGQITFKAVMLANDEAQLHQLRRKIGSFAHS